MFTEGGKIHFSDAEFNDVAAGMDYLGDGVSQAARRNVHLAQDIRGTGSTPGITNEVVSLPELYATDLLSAREVGRVIVRFANPGS